MEKPGGLEDLVTINDHSDSDLGWTRKKRKKGGMFLCVGTADRTAELLLIISSNALYYGISGESYLFWLILY